MSNQEWESMNEFVFDSEMESEWVQLPPEDVISAVTPWKKAMRRILIGMALCAVTLNFSNLNYILPAIGMLLSLLGFRMLRHENKWFKGCFAITIIRMVYFFFTIVLNTTIIHSKVYESPIMWAAAALNIALIFVLFFSFGQGICAVQQRSDLPPHAGGATALIVWYALVCVLALMQYSGTIIAIAMLIAYVFIVCSLYALSKELDEAGYTISPTPVKINDYALSLIIAAVLFIGCLGGYVFGGSYSMNWSVSDNTESSKTEAIKDRLEALGFPENILNDLTEEDISACEGALKVVTETQLHPVNDGREVKFYRDTASDGAKMKTIVHTTLYDVKELCITSVAVKLPAEKEIWKIFHHFTWQITPNFYGTECLRIFPAYTANSGMGLGDAGDLSGRILYDEAGTTYTAPYEYLGRYTHTSNDMFFGQRTSSDIYATFSMPNSGTNHRGYVSYTINEKQHGWIISSYIYYTHRKDFFQYPNTTAMEEKLKGSFNQSDTYKSIPDALQFFPNEINPTE